MIFHHVVLGTNVKPHFDEFFAQKSISNFILGDSRLSVRSRSKCGQFQG